MDARKEMWRRTGRAAALVLLTVTAGGCAFLARGPSALSSALLSQSDPELVRDGAPAYLLLLDGLVASSPRNTKLLLTTSDANAAYAAAFLTPEPQRARLMYAKAKDYALRALRENRAFRNAEHGNVEEFEKGVRSLGRRDLPTMYTAATAWLGWIISSPDSIEATADLSRALALMDRVMKLEPGYRQGGPETMFGIYYAVQPRGAGQDLDKSRRLFLKAIEYSGDSLLPRVAYAEFWARYSLCRDVFESVLNEVINSRPATAEELRLMNAVARERAARLLKQADDLF
jgi:hypothetical protein